MRHAIFNLLLGLLLLTAAGVQAQLSDVEITASRKKLDEQKSRGGNSTTVTKEIVYDVDVKSKTFKPLTNLEVKYMIFYEDAKAGSTETNEKSQSGSETIASLEGNRSYSFQTKPIKLSTEDLDAGWYYTTGSGNRARDKVKGVWFRVYSGGKVIAEYSNPSTLAKKETWKD